jgi:hypothetical protein
MREQTLLKVLLREAHEYAVKAARVRAAKGALSMHTRRLERISKHLRAAYDGIRGAR